MRKIAWKSSVVFFTFVVLMSVAGTALAWQYSRQYTTSTLFGGSQGQAWSPNIGYLDADVGNVNGKRQTNPLGGYVSWGQTALNYIRANQAWPDNYVAITFHSFDINNGCSSFRILDMTGTSLPAPSVLIYVRQCFLIQRPTEVRIRSTNANLISAGTHYWGQAFYEDDNTTTVRQKITVDTYFGSNPNWHQTYCINVGAYLASIC